MLHDTMMTSVDMEQLQPISRTYQYRKVMKPMLERKRRARINRCLDELKELMVSALQSEGENVSKLEKADILELTVRHLHKLRRQQRLSANPVTDADRFRAGFTHCATEVSRCLAATPGVDVQLGTKLMTHLGHRLNDMDKTLPLSIQVGPVPHHHPQGYNTPPGSPAPLSVSSDDSTSSGASCCGDDPPVTTAPGGGSYYGMPLTPSSTASSGSARNLSTGVGLLKVAEVSLARKTPEPVWRPW